MNAVTKAYPRDYKKPVILLHKNATLIDDENEKESLCVPFACMAHGIKIDMVPTKYGGKGGMTVEGGFILFDFDDEKLFIKIQKPTQEDLDISEWYELTSPVTHIRRKHNKLMASNIPIEE